MKHTCYRHEASQEQRLRQEEQQLIAQAQLIDQHESEKINQIFKLYKSLNVNYRNLMLKGILHYSCFPQLSYLSSSLVEVCKIDFIGLLPTEIAIKCLFYLDACSLSRASQCSKKWKEVSDNDVVWKHMCSQHIERKCTKCGWGLPLMSKYFKEEVKNIEDGNSSDEGGPKKKLKLEKRSWKSIYAERSVVASNWKNARFKECILIGHTDIIYSLWYDEVSNILVSASADGTLMKWDILKGVCIGVMKGHTNRVTGCQFDNSKIISCSMDKSIRIWNFCSLQCMRIINGQMSGLVSVHFVDRLLAVGSIEGPIKVWDLEKAKTFNLIGHTHSAQKVWILPGKEQLLSCSSDTSMKLWNIERQQVLRTFTGHTGPINDFSVLRLNHLKTDHINQIVTCSSDSTLKIWDFESTELLRTLKGHEGQVTSVQANQFRIVSCGKDRSLKIWDSDVRECLVSLARPSDVDDVWMGDTVLISTEAEGKIVVRCFLPKQGCFVR